MPLRRYPYFIVTLLLLAFISQQLASAAMKCELTKATKVSELSLVDYRNSESHHTSEHHHSPQHHHSNEMPMHDMAVMDHTDTYSIQHHSNTDCCKTMDHCLLACTVALAAKDKMFAIQKQTSSAIDLYSRKTPAPLASAHYRPPIFS